MKKLCMLFCIAITMSALLAEPQETAGEMSKAPSTQEDYIPNVNTPTPPRQDNTPSGLLGSQPLTPSHQITGAPLDDMLENVNESNTALKSAMSFAKQGDYESALQLFMQSCDQGNAAGCFGSGLIYMYGANSGVPNPQKAVDYYYKACVGGDAVACANLAMAYDNGQGVKEDKDQAAQLYEVACQGGDSLGCTNIGWMYANGVGVKKDYQKALAYYNSACQLGSDLGCYNLGLMSNTYNVYGMTKDKMSYVEMNYVACQQGDIVGCGNLGWMYATGSSGAEKSYYNAAKYFTLACDSGHIQSCNNLGVLYDGGFGVRQDKRKAIELFGLACDYGIESGCNNYSLMRTRGSVSAGNNNFFGLK
ncbi:tetratricopeptide repeat protein [Helicobacter cinaedi]|uniref:tetratricopeptide repeat protein n=1 Tax=Helicobacter cinaedi TaxID=213 RepID=UPI000D7B938D|nr:tetratricopeptide repeat protein [Helicobacter cinaedi]